jgi:hypothetical protein
MKRAPRAPATDELWPPHDPRSREERELDSLREWLAHPSWNQWEAKMVLGGFAPNENAAFHGEELPGGMSWKGKSEDEIRQDYADLMEYVGSFVGGSPRPPCDWLRLAFKNGFQPDWLPACLADTKCCSFLPPEFRSETDKRNTMKESQILKGIARKKVDPIWAIIDRVGDPVFATWWNLDPQHRSTKEKLAEDIRSKVLESPGLPEECSDDEEQASIPTIKNHIRDWVLTKVGKSLFDSWHEQTPRSPMKVLAEQVRTEFAQKVRDRREIPSVGRIARALEQWQAEKGEKRA